MQSTSVIALDQDAATTLGAVLGERYRTPVVHPMPSDNATILQCIERVRRQRAVVCCYEAHRLAARGKRTQQVVAGIVRELTGFV